MIKLLLPIILFILLGKNLFAQEKLNFTDENGRKQGHWIFYGKDMPNSGIPADGKVQEGNYVDDRKEGTWIKYELDGKTPKTTGEFKNNRPQSNCTWYWPSEVDDTVKTSQNNASDTLNFIDDKGRKQGHWIYFGKDRPESGIVPDGKVEEGNYIDDRKEGTWIKYHDDGKTPKVKGEYVNNRPCGKYVKYWQTGEVRESGVFEKNTGTDSLIRGLGYYSTEYTYKWDGTPDTLVKSTSDKNVPLPITPGNPNTRSTPFKPDGYNKVYNSDNEIWLDGQFRNSQLYDGKQYVYDRDGILISVYIFKSGTYHSNGRL